MRLFQYTDDNGRNAVGVVDEDGARVVAATESVYELATAAIAAGQRLAATIAARGLGDAIDIAALARADRLRAPLEHPDPAHLHVTGTGLTHLGSAATRDTMHAGDEEAGMTDSMKMFRMGVEGGKPASGETGVQPEWFYKGDGNAVARPGAPLTSPAFALDGGEEPEIAGLYVIGPDGTPFRIGFALGNEFSDHVTERQNYLYLAHSKLRPASFGPEILLGDLPEKIEGMSRILRAGKVVWEKPFLSGEGYMSHTIANLEHHHFKYEIFRRPGDVHVHMFGTATLSFADGIEVREGDEFHVSAPGFGLPLVNALRTSEPKEVTIRAL